MAAVAPEGSSWAHEFHTVDRDVQRLTNGEVQLKWYLGGIAGDELTVARARAARPARRRRRRHVLRSAGAVDARRPRRRPVPEPRRVGLRHEPPSARLRQGVRARGLRQPRHRQLRQHHVLLAPAHPHDRRAPAHALLDLRPRPDVHRHAAPDGRRRRARSARRRAQGLRRRQGRRLRLHADGGARLPVVGARPLLPRHHRRRAARLLSSSPTAPSTRSRSSTSAP